MVKFKKVLCLVLSFVMLISCVAVSASALADGKTAGFILVPDKTTVNPGDVVTYTLYIDTDSSIQYGQISLIFVYNNSVFTTPTKTSINRQFDGDFANYYKDGSLINVGATVYNNLSSKTSMTAEQKAAYNAAFLLQGTCDTEKGTVADGYTITSADTAQMTFQLTVADTVTPGTTATVEILPCAFELTSNCFYKKITDSTTNGGSKMDVSTIDLTTTKSEIKVGSSTVDLKFSDVKNQIRFDKTADGKYANTFDGRMVVSIDNLADVVGADVNLASVQAKIKEIGFLYAKNGAINADTALAQIKGEGAATYSVATGGGYISTGFAEADYAVTGIIHNIPDADKATAVSAAVYAIYDSNGDGVDEYTVLVLNGGETFTFEDLYSRNFNTAFPA